jgi:solute:Na+ symporter, SSS family
MQSFYLIDKIILIVYFFGITAFGFYFRKKSNTADGFMVTKNKIPSWAVGLSILGTFVSSITFLAYPGQSYNFNWDAFLFTLTMPIAALAAARYFIPLYRNKIGVASYVYLEQRFGSWARIYASVSFIFGQITRVGMILFLLSLPLHNLTGWSYTIIILATGFSTVIYTMYGGMEAVIWTDVIQVIILFGGALLAIGFIVFGMPEGPGQVIAIAMQDHKFSFGNWNFDLTMASAWVVVFYGLMENMRNFAVDQNYVQRYHTTATTKDAARSVWTAVWGYFPISAMFLFIGTALYAFYKVQPALLPVELQQPSMGDKIFPYFITTQLPVGIRGLIVAALFAAAMSTISSCLNCMSTLTLLDFYKKYFNADADDQKQVKLLRLYTLVWGVIGTVCGLALIKIQSALETGWKLGGIAGGGVIGLFLLAIMFPWIKRGAALVAVIFSVLSIAWATFAHNLPAAWKWLEFPWQSRMIGVIGTIVLLFVGVIIGLLIQGMAMRQKNQANS